MLKPVFFKPRTRRAGKCDTCDGMEVRFRTYDGHCNALASNETGMGMKGQRFGRSALWTDGRTDPGLWEPDPYECAPSPA